MPEQVAATPPLIACPACGGLGLRMASCACRHNGNSFLTSGITLLSDSEPYSDCELCHGSGDTTVMCFPCRQGGQLRIQGVLTVVNAATGQTASVQVVPGAFDVVPWPVKPGRRIIDLSPVLRALGEEVNADLLYDCLDQRIHCDELVMPIFLPESWNDDAPAEEREAAEQAAIAEWAGRRRWHLYLGYPAGMRPESDPERQLRELKATATATHLDLVVRHVDNYWSLVFEVPGALRRPGQCWYAGPLSLSEAVLAVSADDLVEHMKSTTTVGGHWVRTRRSAPIPDASSGWTVRQLEEAISQATKGAGGSATWRDGRWHVSSLRVAEEREILTTQRTGQVRATIERVLELERRLDVPTWQSDSIPTQPCGRCSSGVAWQDCPCTHLGEPPLPECPRCAGVGQAPAPYCASCDDTKFVHFGAIVTLIGPNGRGMTLNLGIPENPAVEYFVNEHGVRFARVPRELTAAGWAERFGTDSDWLCSQGVRTVGALARDGVIPTDLTDSRAVVAEYLTRLTAGRPGGRLVYFVRPPGDAPVDALLRVVTGVDARLEISAATDRNGDGHAEPRVRWGVAVAHRRGPSRYAPPEVDLTLGDAVSRINDSLPQRLGAIEHDVGRTELLAPPQSPSSVDIEADIEPMLRDLAVRYKRVLAYATRSGWTVHVWTHRRWTRIGAAATLRETIENAHLS